MDSFRIIFWILLLATVSISFSECKGVFELRLLQYENSNSKDVNGNCCGENASNGGLCLNSCSTFFRVCLKEYQTEIDLSTPCTYGSRITELVPNSNYVDFSLQLGFEEPLQFPFSFGWPGYYTLILEAYHNSSAAENENAILSQQLLLRVAEHRNVKPGSNWQQETFSQGSSKLSFESRVLCSESYYGEQCSVSCRPRDDSFGHFTCSPQGQKICLPGWQGRFCNEAVCSPGCDPVHGSCANRPNECICEMGWVGATCSECQKYPGCKHGTCSEKPFECKCEEGWGGIFCNQDLNYCTHHRPCLNGATCTNTGQGHYTCKCQPGYTGTNCETKIQDCSMSPCLNGGFCQELETNYTCSCPDNFSGRHCQINAKTCADNPCTNGASCVDSFDGYQCLCSPGWTGANCDIETDECQSDPCLNGGRCVDRFNGYQCSCPVGFEGSRCEININDCSETTCQNGGRCFDDINNFRCDCPAGFSGTLCQYNIDDCIKRPCANGGTCFDEVNGFSCMCRPGFRGKDCAIDINECASNPCRNGGKCDDLVDDYRCQCPPCYSGKNCETRHDDCRFQQTFRPFYSQSTTPSYPVYPPRAGQASNGGGNQDLQQTLMIIVIPVIVAFVIIVLILGLIVLFLFRRAKRNERTDVERQNERNQRLAALAAPECINNKFVSGLNTAVVPPFSGKIDNTERSATLKGKNLDRLNCKESFSSDMKLDPTVNFNPGPLAAVDRNTFSVRPVCKAISVDKLNYSQKHRLSAVPTASNRKADQLNSLYQPRKGFEGRGCISPTPASPREAISPPSSPAFFLKTEISKDSGLGSEAGPSLPVSPAKQRNNSSSRPAPIVLADSESLGSDLDSYSSPRCSSNVSTTGERTFCEAGAKQSASPRSSGSELIVCATAVARQQNESPLESGQRAQSTGRSGSGEPNRTLQHQVHRHGPRPKPPPRNQPSLSSSQIELATQV